MEPDKIKELIQKCLEEILQEDGVGGNVSANAGGYLGKFAFKKPPKMKPLEEKMGVLGPKAFIKPNKKHETSKTGFEEIPNLDLHMETMKFKIVDSKEEPLNESNSTTVNYKPYIVRDANNPNFLKIFVKYPEGVGHLAAYGQKTLSGQEREYGIKKAMEIGQALASKLESSYNLEDIDVSDNGDGKVIVFAVSDDFIDMQVAPMAENKEVDEIVGEESDMAKWRRANNGKAFARKTVYLTSPMGAKSRYTIFLNYKETPTEDVIYTTEKLYQNHEGGGSPESLSNLQNKPERYLSSEDTINFKDEESLNKIIKNPKELESIFSDFVGDDVDGALKDWFKSGVRTVEKIDPVQLLRTFLPTHAPEFPLLIRLSCRSRKTLRVVRLAYKLSNGKRRRLIVTRALFLSD